MRKNKKLPQPTLAESRTAIVLGVLFLVLCAGGGYAVYHVSSSRALRSDVGQVPVYFKQAKDAMPFPETLDPAQFQLANVREAFSAANEIPDVLVQQPCYCFCERIGHRSLLDCFRSLHATNCSICINEARLARRLHQKGKTAEEIRAAIIETKGSISGVEGI